MVLQKNNCSQKLFFLTTLRLILRFLDASGAVCLTFAVLEASLQIYGFSAGNQIPRKSGGGAKSQVSGSRKPTNSRHANGKFITE